MGVVMHCRQWLLLSLVVAPLCPADQPSVTQALNATRLIDARQINDPKRAQDWLSHGRTWSEQRFSPLDQISTRNVSDLGLAWSLDLPSKGTLEATPLVSNGIVYTTGSWGVVFAVDARNGKLIWSYDPQAQMRSAEAIVWDRHRGVALWKGKVYVAVADGRLIALDAVTGKKLWEAQTFDRSIPYGSTGAPRVFDGRVIIGMSGGDIGTRGYASAYDAETGKLLWRFYAVPGDPAQGFESKAMAMAAKTWTGEWWKYGGGGNPWNAFSYDPKLKLVYLALGNGGPSRQDQRSPGGGDNLFLASIVAVKVDTGEYVWHYQTTPGEVWDYDSCMDMVLADIKLNGRIRQVLLHAPKNGFFYVIDRRNGELLSAKNYVRVTWADHIDMTTGRPVEYAGARMEDGPVEIEPGFSGAHSWHPMSFSPQTKLVYIPYLDAGATVSRPDPKDWKFSQGVFDMPIIQPARNPSSGGLLAWDPVNQREAWRVVLASKYIGGTATTAGGLVFAGTGDGRLLAFDAFTGQQLWEAPANNAVMGGPAVFSIDGVEYVAVMAGIGGGFSQNPTLLSRGYRYGEGRRLLAFRLGGQAQLPPMPLPLPLPAPRPVSSDPAVQRGAALFGPHCGSCHGPNAVNSGGAPDLRRSPMIEALPAVLLEGALVSQGMPSFKKYLRVQDVDDLRAYLKDRAIAAPN
jgi:quinohemoprotein ethanol dehydrogenase